MTLYESASDRRHEQEIITTLASHIPNTMFVKLNMTWRVDYAIYQGHKLYAFVECKRRLVNSKEYPTIILSGTKYIEGKKFATTFNVPFIFAVQFNDCLSYVDLTKDDYDLVIAGGKQRNLASDIDLCIAVPSNKFKVFKEHPSRFARGAVPLG